MSKIPVETNDEVRFVPTLTNEEQEYNNALVVVRAFMKNLQIVDDRPTRELLYAIAVVLLRTPLGDTDEQPTTTI